MHNFLLLFFAQVRCDYHSFRHAQQKQSSSTHQKEKEDAEIPQEEREAEGNLAPKVQEVWIDSRIVGVDCVLGQV